MSSLPETEPLALRLLEREAVLTDGAHDFEGLNRAMDTSLAADERPVRFAVTSSTKQVL